MLKKALIGMIAISLSLGMVACGSSNSNQANANKSNNETNSSVTQAEPNTSEDTNNDAINKEFVVTNDITHYEGITQQEFSEAEKATINFVKSNLNIDAKEVVDANQLNELVNNMFSNYGGNNLNNAKQSIINHFNNVVIPNEQKTSITKINIDDVDREPDGIEIDGVAIVKVDKYLNKKQIEGTEQKVEFSVTTQNGKVVDYDIDDLVDDDD